MEFDHAVVTGGTGVVGSALIAALLSHGVRVLALVRKDSPNNRNLPTSPLLTVAECSLEDMASFENPTEEQWDVFYHLGWTGTKGADRFDPVIHTQNVQYALEAVKLAKRLGCGQFIGAGSQAEYGRVAEKLTPDTPVHPENAYGIGKLAAGMMTRVLCHQLGMQHVWTRILSVYGPNDGPKTLVTYMIRSLIGGERPSTTEGGQIWDLLFSEDAAEALYLAAANGRDGRTYLIGSGQEKTLREQIETIRDAVAPGAEIGFGEVPYAEKQVMYLACDISQTTEDLGWKPETPLTEGARKLAEAMERKNG